MNNKIVKLQQGNYFKWNNLSREDKVKRNKQIAQQYLDKGPSIQNYYNALKAYFGGFNPENPYLQTGEPIILPGTNPTKGVQTVAKAVRTLEDYLKTTKVAAPVLEGNSAARSAYATDRYIGGRLFQNKLPDEAMKVQGHGMSKSSSLQDALARLRYMLDNGLEKGKTFYTAPLKVSKEAARAGEAIGTGGATPYFDGHFLITGKPGQMINSIDDIGTIYINDAYENEEALKAAQKMKEYLTKTYPNKVFKLYSEGFKKGGSLKPANARKWKHQTGGTLVKTLGGGNTITAKQKAKSNLTKRKAPDWDNLDRGYRYLTQDMKLPHDQAIAIMGNVVEESQGDYKATQKNGRGRGLIQWDGRPAPKGRYGQWGSIWASVAKKANVYDPDTDTVKNYWAPWNGLKGDQVRQKFISAPLKQKARIYAESYLRPGKPRIADRQLSAMQLDSIYNPKIKNIVVQQKVGGKIDFLSLGGIASGIKNIVNNVGNFMKSDTGKSILSAGSSLLGLGKSISNSGKITDAANEAEEAINAQESADRQKSFAEKYAAILQEKLSKPDIDVNGSPIHTNGVNVTNEAYNQAVNTFNFDNSKYNQMRQQIKEQAQQVQNENSSSMIGSVGNIFNQIQGLAGNIFGNNKQATKGTATGSTVGATSSYNNGNTTTYTGTNGSLRLNNMLA